MTDAYVNANVQTDKHLKSLVLVNSLEEKFTFTFFFLYMHTHNPLHLPDNDAINLFLMPPKVCFPFQLKVVSAQAERRDE